MIASHTNVTNYILLVARQIFTYSYLSYLFLHNVGQSSNKKAKETKGTFGKRVCDVWVWENCSVFTECVKEHAFCCGTL